MRTTFRKTAVAGIAGLALVLTACGGDTEDTATETTTDVATDTTTDAATTEAASPEATTEAMATESTTEAMAMEPTGEACSQLPEDGPGSAQEMANDPIATAAGTNPLLSSLVTAVGEAELVRTLDEAEELTVFAPTNPAFDALPEGVLDSLLEDQDQLTSVLTLHVAEGTMDAAALTDAGTVTTLNDADLEFDGEALTVTSPDGTVANVVCANIPAANGVIHLIDAVLMPAG